MYSSFSDNETIQRGRKKVYSATEKLELLLPNRKSDGFLEVGDLIYVAQRIKGKDNNITFRFRVMKFADTKKAGTIYSADKKYFKQYFEKKSQAEGDETESKKPNYIVPAITSLGGAGLAYMIGKKYQKNAVMYGVGGLAIGLAIGIFLLNKKNTK